MRAPSCNENQMSALRAAAAVVTQGEGQIILLHWNVGIFRPNIRRSRMAQNVNGEFCKSLAINE